MILGTGKCLQIKLQSNRFIDYNLWCLSLSINEVTLMREDEDVYVFDVSKTLVLFFTEPLLISCQLLTKSYLLIFNHLLSIQFLRTVLTEIILTVNLCLWILEMFLIVHLHININNYLTFWYLAKQTVAPFNLCSYLFLIIPDIHLFVKGMHKKCINRHFCNLYTLKKIIQ